MKIMFFGLGSIGGRHAKILAENYGHELYAFRAKKNSPNEFRIPEVYTWDEVEKIRPDVAFITNPTFLHVETAIKCARLGMGLFIEKPIGSSRAGLDTLIKEAKKRSVVTYVAYNLRFHPVIEYLKEHLAGKKINHMSVYTASFLPKWRASGWHLDSYSASRDKGGGVILDLSHEFDYIEFLAGPIKDMVGLYDRVSDVTVDAEDFVDAVIRTERTHVNLHIDFLSHHTERTIKVDCDGEFIMGDLVNNRVEIRGSGDPVIEQYDMDRNESYRKQIAYFLGNMDDTRMMNNLFDARGLFEKILNFKEKAR